MMNLDSIIRRGHPILFGLLLIFSIIQGSITAWLTSRYETNLGAAFDSIRSRTHFLLFASWWTAVGSALFIFFFLRGAGGAFTSVASHGIFLTITWIFWFAGAITVTVSLHGGINCSNNVRHVVFCGQLEAMLGFAWTIWIITTILLFFVLLRGITSLRRGDGAKGQLVYA